MLEESTLMSEVDALRSDDSGAKGTQYVFA